MKIKLEFKWNDIWIGAFWKIKTVAWNPGRWAILEKEFHIWICVVPCLPIHIWWKLKA